MASSARIDELKKKFDENPRRYFAPLANEYRKAGDLAQAVFICEEYLPQQPGHMSGHIVYAQTLFELGRYDDAKAAFGAAIALDPENLIALRHLGDIAKQAGDLETARAWYERVLEADPRNEEIVEAMASLGTAPATTRPSAPPPTPVVQDTATPPPIRTPALSFAPPEPPRPSPFAPAPPLPAPPAEDLAAADDLLDLDDLTIGGAPLTMPADSSGTVGESTPSEAAAEVPSGSIFSTENAADAHSTDESAAFESDPFAITANEEPSIERAADLNLGLIDDGSETESSPIVEALDGLHSFEAGVLAHSAEPVESDLDMKPFYDVFHGESTPAAPVSSIDGSEASAAAEEESTATSADFDSDLAETPASSTPMVREPTPPVGNEVFVTETMAELYLQQGHFDSAVDIYRKLLDQRPDDAILLERVRYAEGRLYGTTEPAAASEAHEEPRSTSGPTIREFLVSLVSGGSMPVTQAGDNGHSTEPTPSEPVSSMSRATLPGSIDALFPGTGSSSTDSTAATALAGAFGLDDFDIDIPEQDTSLHANEQRDRAASEKTPPATDVVTEGFSFDQFFSGDASAPTTKPSTDAAKPPVESPEDVAQFNAWLSGLKKT